VLGTTGGGRAGIVAVCGPTHALWEWMSRPMAKRWMQTRVPPKLGVLISLLTAFVAGFSLNIFLSGGHVLFVVFAVLIFALAGWSFAASVTKLRAERESKS
jgi:hypothetical protein